jgi:hypothetical protein
LIQPKHKKIPAPFKLHMNQEEKGCSPKIRRIPNGGVDAGLEETNCLL